MEALLIAIVIWLSANFDLPEYFIHPRIEFHSEAELAGDYSLAVETGWAWAAAAPPTYSAGEIAAFYDPGTRSIHLAEGWTGITAAELSILVHEMVHHLQEAAGMRFACAQEREKLAFDAQAQWLALFGDTLENAVGVTPLTRLLRTNCAF